MYEQMKCTKRNCFLEKNNSFIQKKNGSVLQMKDYRNSITTKKSLCSILAETQLNSSPVQFTITGGGYDYWAKNVQKIAGKKLEKILDFLEKVHRISNIDFSLDEISEFYKSKLETMNHAEMSLYGNERIFDDLKHFVALKRDDEGGHGAMKHGDPGKQFLVDRINSGEVSNASSLDIDEYLQWDTILKREESGIYETYLSLLETRKGEIRGAASEPFQGVEDLKMKLREKEDENVTKSRKTYNTQNDRIKRLSILTDIRYGGISEDDSKAKRFKIPIGAEVHACGIKFPGKSVKKRINRTPVEISDVVDVEIQPKAFTGSLSPVYTVEKNGIFYGKPDKEKLSWVTKF